MDGAPGWFAAVFVLAIVIGIGGFALRIHIARRIARNAGLDPDVAAAATAFGTGGLTATYLAANLHGGAPPTYGPDGGHINADLSPDPVPPSATRTAEQRLLELQGLKDKGLVTDGEYDERRRSILADL